MCDTLGSVRLQQTSIRIAAPDLKKLTTLAEAEGLNASDLIRRAIREFLKNK
jgi:hypothetical protein